MKKQRKIVFWAASLLLTGALAAGGTLAYLTDKDSVTNQFLSLIHISEPTRPY